MLVQLKDNILALLLVNINAVNCFPQATVAFVRHFPSNLHMQKLQEITRRLHVLLTRLYSSIIFRSFLMSTNEART